MTFRRMGLLAVLLAIGMTGTVGVQAAQQKDDGKKDEKSSDESTYKAMASHALKMAIEGSSLQLGARRVGTQPVQPGQVQSNQTRTQQLLTEARTSFDSANKLFTDVRNKVVNEKDSTRCKRFYNAAVRYVQTLTALSSEQPVAAGTNPRGAPVAPLTTEDLASIRLINHSVCEAMDACSIKDFLRRHESGSTAGADTLRDHAKQMSASSERWINRLVQEIPATATGARPAQPAQPTDPNAPPTVQLLARQAQEIIQFIQEDDKNDDKDQSRRSGG